MRGWVAAARGFPAFASSSWGNILIPSPNHSSRGGAKVRLLVVHTAEGARTAQSLGDFFARTDVEASSHVGIDANSVEQYVPYDRASWTVLSANPISENVELCGFAHWSREQWLSTGMVDGCANPRAMLDRLAGWLAERVQARGIEIKKLSPHQVAAGDWGICGHVDWTVGTGDGTHTDPGPAFPWDYVITRANQLAHGNKEDDVSWNDQLPNPNYRKDTPGTGQPTYAAGDWLVYNNVKTDQVSAKLDALTEKVNAPAPVQITPEQLAAALGPMLPAIATAVADELHQRTAA
ncbi:N-acetylmuramoyl-L-alanine amidase [Pseudonocardiaceae bacterium YIM PH 21723]|nr:N-acetylmuramoyl-L-alanine amidase [Pseudonocardiaceae bacterium YIM PH 21723]